MVPISHGPRPVRITRHDSELGCDVRRVVGYVARCDACGWQTPTCSKVRYARIALDMHAFFTHGGGR